MSRIVLVGPLYPYRGGIAHSLETLYRGLAARGHTVSAVNFRRQYPALLFPGKTQYEERPEAERLPSERLIDTVKPWTWWQAARRIAHARPEAVIFKYWMPFMAPALGSMARWLRRRGIRVLAVVDNALPHERRPGDEALSRYFLRACDGLVVLSEAVADEVRALGVTAPVRQVPHPVYDLFGEAAPRAAARARLGLRPEAPVLLFFGFIRRYKGLHVLLDAMPAIVRALPDVRLVVAGEFYDGEAPYRAQIERHGLAPHLLLHSAYIPTTDVPAYFAAADVVVQPYLSATQSGVAQIAYHFDRPLIVTTVGGLPEVVPHEKAGLLVPPDDPDALAQAVVRFFRDDGLAERLTEGVRQEKRHYSWDRLYDAVESLL